MADATLVPKRITQCGTLSDTADNCGGGFVIGATFGATGTVRCRMINNRGDVAGEGYVDMPVQAGQTVPGAFRRIYSSGTSGITASQIMILHSQ